MTSTSKKNIEQLATQAGITINGDQPWDIQVKNEKFYDRVLRQWSLGLGESYMDGWWEVKRLDTFFCKIFCAGLEKNVRISPIMLWGYVKSKLINLQRLRPFQVGEEHYDLGNDLYKAMLDKRLAYTCGYWKDAKTLDEAQEAKFDLICKKLDLKKGDRILDIGSGWGSFIKFAAERYGARAVGVTVSKEQAEFANANRGDLPIETRVQDYLDVYEKFDHIVSIGMFEHVGYKNYRAFMGKVSSLLKDDGLFLLHTIGGNRSVIKTDPWIEKYIFPNGMLPSISQIGKSIENIFVMEDWHNFGPDYYKTLMAWYKNFDINWDSLSSRYDNRFNRMWRYYLLSSAASFCCRKNQLWQIVLSKNGVHGGYVSIR